MQGGETVFSRLFGLRAKWESTFSLTGFLTLKTAPNNLSQGDMEFWAFKFPAILFLVKTSNSLVSAEPSAVHFIADQDMWKNCGSFSNSSLTPYADRRKTALHMVISQMLRVKGNTHI